MSNFDKDYLINKINKKPGSAHFPILAYLYLKDNEINKAASTCEYGLKINPESIEGNFILAQILILKKNLHDAEKILKFVVNRHSAHINAWKLLFKIQIDLEKNDNVIKETVTSLLKIKPQDKECLNWLKDLIKSKDNKSAIEKEVNKSTEKENKYKKITIPEEVVPINTKMATFTLAKIFMNQGYYHQALEILKIIKEKGENKRRIKNMKKQIINAMKLQQEAETHY